MELHDTQCRLGDPAGLLASDIFSGAGERSVYRTRDDSPGLGLTRRVVDDVTAFLGVRWPHTLVLGSVTLDPVIYIQVGYATTHITDSCRHRRGGSNWAHCCACLDRRRGL